MLSHIARFYQREVDYDLKRLNDIIEPALIIGLSSINAGICCLFANMEYGKICALKNVWTRMMIILEYVYTSNDDKT
jgi:hypothetical protein